MVDVGGIWQATGICEVERKIGKISTVDHRMDG